MKITLALPLSIATLLLAACGQNDAPAPVTVADTPTTTAAPVAPFATVREYSYAGVPTQGGYCSLDTFSGSAPVTPSTQVGMEAAFAGWLADVDLTVPAEAQLVFRSDQGAYAIPLALGGERPDVAAVMTSDALVKSGFGASAALDLAPGDYALSVVVNPAEGRECDLNTRLQVTE